MLNHHPELFVSRFEPYICHSECSEESTPHGIYLSQYLSVAEFYLSQIFRSLRSIRMTEAKDSFRMTLETEGFLEWQRVNQ